MLEAESIAELGMDPQCPGPVYELFLFGDRWPHWRRSRLWPKGEKGSVASHGVKLVNLKWMLSRDSVERGISRAIYLLFDPLKGGFLGAWD